MLNDLKAEVCRANRALVERGLVRLTFGNVSGIDPERQLVVIKPSGVPYDRLAPETMVARIAETLRLKDVLTGLVKSVSFAWIITIIAVDRGLAFRGGAAGVGHATTNSVVASLFGIIVLDLAWGLIFYL